MRIRQLLEHDKGPLPLWCFEGATSSSFLQHHIPQNIELQYRDGLLGSTIITILRRFRSADVIQILCTICGVSFNIGRIRTPTEPRSAAWNGHGPVPSDLEPATSTVYQLHNGAKYTYVDAVRNSWTGECSRDSGCMFVMRSIKDEGRKVIINKRGRRKLSPKEETIYEGDDGGDGDEMQDDNDIQNDDNGDGNGAGQKVPEVRSQKNHKDDDDDEDEDWAEQSDDDDEPLEYDSDFEEGATSDIEMGDADSSDEDALEKDFARNFWLQAMTDPAGLVEDDMFPLFYPGRDGASEYGTDDSFEESESEKDPDSATLHHRLTGKLGYYDSDSYEVEHIAGPGCVNVHGYSGHNISVEEMRGCHIFQCLVPKPEDEDNFEYLEDDEEFETDGRYFLSGLGYHMPSRDDGWTHVYPERHDCGDPNADNWIWDQENIGEHALPFHPPCFEVYKRASLLAKGMIDVEGLTNWWGHRLVNSQYLHHSDDQDVQRCSEQWWDHVRGTEYLAANPLFVPKLREIFQAATNTAPGFSPRNGAFTIPGTAAPENSTDIFSRLPMELRFGILDDLDSKDIAALRLSSRAFRQLPIFYFQKLINREMPWLWEAWPTEKNPDQLRYALWATMSPAAADAKLQKGGEDVAAIEQYFSIVSEEMPEMKDMLEELLPYEIEAAEEAHRLELEEYEDRKPFFLPPQGTNYFQLYTLITRHWADLKGLRNRKRIWKDCAMILGNAKERTQ